MPVCTDTVINNAFLNYLKTHKNHWTSRSNVEKETIEASETCLTIIFPHLDKCAPPFRACVLNLLNGFHIITTMLATGMHLNRI